MQSPGSSNYAATPAEYLHAPLTNLNQAGLAYTSSGSPTPAPAFELDCPVLFQYPRSMPMAMRSGNEQSMLSPCSPLTGLKDNFSPHVLTMTPANSIPAHADLTQTCSPGAAIPVGRRQSSSQIDIGSPTPNLEPQSIPNISTDCPTTPTQNKQHSNLSSRALKRKTAVVVDEEISQGATRLLPERHERKQNFACELCRKLKIRCVFYPGKAKCMRCERSDVECLDGSSMRAAAAAARARQGLRKRRKKSVDLEEEYSDPEPTVFSTKTIRTRPVADVYQEVVDDPKSGIQLGSIVQVKKSSQHHYKTKERKVTRVICKVVAVCLDGAETDPIPCNLVRLCEKDLPSKTSEPTELNKDKCFNQKHPTRHPEDSTPILRKGTSNMGLELAQSSSSAMSDLQLQEDYTIQTLQPHSAMECPRSLQEGESAKAVLSRATIVLPTTAKKHELGTGKESEQLFPTVDSPPLFSASSFQDFATMFAPHEFNIFHPIVPEDASQLSRALEPSLVSSSISPIDESPTTCLKRSEDQQSSRCPPMNTNDFLWDHEPTSPLLAYDKSHGKSMFPSSSFQKLDSASSPNGTCARRRSTFNSPMQRYRNCFPMKEGNDIRHSKISSRLAQRPNSPLGLECPQLSLKKQPPDQPDQSFMFFDKLQSFIDNIGPSNSITDGVKIEVNRLQEDLVCHKSQESKIKNSLSGGNVIKIVEHDKQEIGSSSRAKPATLETFASDMKIVSSQNLSNESETKKEERRFPPDYPLEVNPQVEGAFDKQQEDQFLSSFSIPKETVTCEISCVNQHRFP